MDSAKRRDSISVTFGFVRRLVRALADPRRLPEKLVVRWRTSKPYERLSALRSDPLSRSLRAQLAAVARQAAPVDRFAPVFEACPEGIPDVDGRTLDAHWYWRGVPKRLPVDSALPAAIGRLVEAPVWGSSNSKLAPIFYDLAARARSVFEAGFYTGVTSTAILEGLGQTNGAYLGTDVLVRAEAQERLRPYLGPHRCLLPAPAGALNLPAGCFDLIFLDMVHKVEMLAPTLERVLPWLARGGVLAIDDIGYRNSLYTDESYRAHIDSLSAREPVERLAPLVGRKNAYCRTRTEGHLAALEQILPETGRRFSHHHIPDGGGTLFLWERTGR